MKDYSPRSMRGFFALRNREHAHAAHSPIRFRARRRDERRRPLDPDLRDPFLRSVAAALQGQAVIGPGVVARVCAELQRQFFHPPDLAAGTHGRSSKYR
jgi:hypothetical protein